MRVGSSGRKVALQPSRGLEPPPGWARFTRTPELPVQVREEEPLAPPPTPLPAGPPPQPAPITPATASPPPQPAPVTPATASPPPQLGVRATLSQLQKKLSGARLSLTFLREQIRMSEVSSVGAIAGLLREHASDLAAYLSTDPKGSLVPKFLDQLGTELAREQTLLQKECEQLARSLDEIRGLLDEQQAGGASKRTAAEPPDPCGVCGQAPFSVAEAKA